MQTLWQDLRYGARMLMKKPGFTLIAVITLALGIGANTAIFSVVNAVLVRPLPYPESERLVWVSEYRPNFGVQAISYPNFTDWRAQQKVFEHIGVYTVWGNYNLTGRGEPQRLSCSHMSADLFSALRVEAVIGRVFNNDEDKPGAPPVVVLSHRLWQNQFGGDRGVIGQSITLDGRAYSVIGVMPVDFVFPRRVDFWLPAGPLSNDWLDRGSGFGLLGIGRLKPGVTPEQARAEMNAIEVRLGQQFPEIKGRSVKIEPLLRITIGGASTALWTLLGAVGLVLLIACANVANLLLARAATRQREMAVRAALGAGRWRIIRQLLTESILLALAGSALGWLVALWGVPLILAIGQDAIPRAKEISFDTGVLAFTAVVALLTGILFGLAPAWQSSRVDVQSVLKDAERSMTGGRPILRQALIVVEVALTLALLVGAGLLARSFYRLQHIDIGFVPERALSFVINLPEGKYSAEERQLAFHRSLDEKLRALPGVEEVAFASQFPLGGRRWQNSYFIDGQPRPQHPPSMELTVVSPNYFRTLGIPLLRGRYFTERDNLEHLRGPEFSGKSEEERSKAAVNVIIVDEEFARRHWPNEDPIGKRVSGLTVVGVVARVKMERLGEQGGLVQAYIPLLQAPSHGRAVVIRTMMEPEAMIAAARRRVLEIDPELPIYDVRTLTERLENSLAPERLNLSLLGSFAAVALLLAVIGLYGVVSYAVTQREKEIGIRVALGAQSRDVLKLVIGQGMKLVLIGVLIGLGAALALTRLMRTLLFSVSATDPLTFALIALLLTVVALLACYIPARRATKVDPMVALRRE